MELTPQIIDDLTLYGGIFFFLIVLFFVLGDESKKKREAHLKRAALKTTHSNKEDIDKVERNLRKAGLNEGDSFINKLAQRLQVAGVEMSAQKYLAFTAGGVLLILVSMTIILHKPVLLSALVSVILGIGVPHFLVSRAIKGRQKAFLKLFPDAIDLIVRGLSAGLPVSQSMVNVAEEIPEPVKATFKEITEQVALGMTFEKALESAAKKLSMTEFNFFITSIILQRETGGNLGEILNNLSEVLRSRQTMRLKIKALSSEAKASATIVGALPFLVFIALNVMSPEYVEPLYDDFRGNLAMFGALCSLGFGVFIMSRMSKFEI